MIFGFPGDGINGIFEALRTHQDKIRFIQVRHEEAAAFAACGYAKYTGRLGVCLATSGPGGIHLLNGLYDAKCDGQPVLAITGHTFHDLIGTHYQQDVDLDKLFMDVAVYNERVMGPAHVDNVVDEAIKTALARRGVAHITIPKDIQEWTADDAHALQGEHRRHTAATLRRRRAAAARASSCSRRPTFINAGQEGRHPGRARLPRCPRGGAGAGRARRRRRSSSRCWARPSCPTTARTPPAASACSARLRRRTRMEECDTLLIVGSSFPYMEFYPKPGQAQVRADRHRPGAHRPALSGRRRPGRRLPAASSRRCCRSSSARTTAASCETAQKRMKEWNELMRGARHAHGQADEAAGGHVPR